MQPCVFAQPTWSLRGLASTQGARQCNGVKPLSLYKAANNLVVRCLSLKHVKKTAATYLHLSMSWLRLGRQKYRNFVELEPFLGLALHFDYFLCCAHAFQRWPMMQSTTHRLCEIVGPFWRFCKKFYLQKKANGNGTEWADAVFHSHFHIFSHSQFHRLSTFQVMFWR